MSTEGSDTGRKTDMRRQADWVASLTVIGSVVTGVVSLVGGFVAMNASGTTPMAYIGAGACWAASGLAFGLLANAIYRR